MVESVGSRTFKWSSIQINKNTVSALHRDSGNLGLSAIALFGNFQAGELIIHGDTKTTFDDRNTLLIFDGHVPHESRPYTGGDRYSIVVFYHSAVARLARQKRRFLENVGFCLPDIGQS